MSLSDGKDKEGFKAWVNSLPNNAMRNEILTFINASTRNADLAENLFLGGKIVAVREELERIQKLIRIDQIKNITLAPFPPVPPVPPPTRYRSVAIWPKGCFDSIGNRSEDSHHSKEAAEAVCHILMRDGAGGEGKFFPIKVYAEPIEE